MMDDFLGFAGLFAVALVTLLCSLLWPRIARPLWVAFAVRAATSIFNVYGTALPGSVKDAVKFEHLAWEWAQQGFVEALHSFTGPDTYFVSWLLSLVYSVTGRSLLMAQSMSTLFGMGTVVAGWLLARHLWGERSANKAIWVLALFPTLILYSALTMREAYIWFFMLLGMLGVSYWATGRGYRGGLLATVAFIGATMFHGAMILSLLAFFGLVVVRSGKSLITRIRRGYLRPVAIGSILAGAVVIGAYATGNFSVPKLGTFDQATRAELLLRRIDWGSRDTPETTAHYPSWLVPHSLVQVAVLAPARVAYFLFAPFPWDVRIPRHLIGLVDGLMYLGLTLFIWRNRRALWASQRARAVLLVMLPALLVFSIAIGNFGTALRHRGKFVAILIVLAAPQLPHFVLRREDSRSPLVSASQGFR